MSRESHRHMVRRYEKERQRNMLARPGVHDFVIVLDRLKSGYNVPKIFRSAEAFGARAVYLIDIGPFDPAPAKGSFRKVPARFFASFAECHAALAAENRPLFILDPAGGENLCQTDLPPGSAFIFGHEEWGFSFDANTYPGLRRLSIPQFGQVQSFNVSIAASLVMYEYVRQRLQGGSIIP